MENEQTTRLAKTWVGEDGIARVIWVPGAEVTLEDSKEVSLIEADLDPLVTISVQGKIMDSNAAAASGTGVPRERLKGTDFSDYFTDPDSARAAYRDAFTKGAVRNYPLTMRHVSGKLTEVLYNASVYRSEKGEVAGVLAVARDYHRAPACRTGGGIGAPRRAYRSL